MRLKHDDMLSMVATGNKPAYEEFEHAADIGLRARGASLVELFENAGRGMVELMLDPSRIRPRETREITVAGQDAETMLVTWLGEILFAFDADRFAPAQVEVESVGHGEAKGRLVGESFVEWRHEVRNPIKGVTYHNLKIEQSGEGYQVDIVFDV